MYVFKYLCMYLCVYVCLFVCMYLYVCVCMHCMHVFVCKCMYSMYVYMCMYVQYVCVCVYVWMYVCEDTIWLLTSRICVSSTVAPRCRAAFGRFGRPAGWKTLYWSRCCGFEDGGCQPCTGWLCGCLVVYVCMYVRMYVCMYVFEWMCLFVCIDVYMYVCMNVCMYVVCNVWQIILYVCTYVCYVCYVCMYAGTCLHTYIHTSIESFSHPSRSHSPRRAGWWSFPPHWSPAPASPVCMYVCMYLISCYVCMYVCM